MGGVAGHLAHLYDNRDLTFNKMAEILQKAASGELVGTEKTDGYNIYLGYEYSPGNYGTDGKYRFRKFSSIKKHSLQIVYSCSYWLDYQGPHLGFIATRCMRLSDSSHESTLPLHAEKYNIGFLDGNVQTISPMEYEDSYYDVEYNR